MLPDIDLRSVYRCCYCAFAMAAFATGLLVKAPVLSHASRLSRLKAGITGIGLTAAWWILDVIVIGCAATVSVMVWNVMLGLAYSGAVWFSLILIAPMIRSTLEMLLLRLIFSRIVGWKGFGLLCLANEICIAVAIYAMILYDRAHPPEA